MRAPVPPLSISRLAAAGLLALLPAAARAGAVDYAKPYYDRTFMVEADVKCRLFQPKLSAALVGATLQLRGAALRGGTASGSLDGVAAQARARADREPCASPDLHIAAQRVRAAFMGWSRQASLALPGTRSAWTATRWPLRVGPYWTLSTPASIGGRPATLGFRRLNSQAPDQFWLWTSAAGAERAFALRLVLRDPSRAPDPYLAAGPPTDAARAFLARDRQTAPQGGVLFRLPDAAAAALAGLDPRETVRLELALPDGARERTVAATVEVGDFAVGRAFLAAGG